MKHLQRNLSLFLCIVLCLSFFPFSAVYAEEAGAEENVEDFSSVEFLDAEEPDQAVIQDDTALEEQENSHEHSFTAVVTDPTGTEQGFTTYTCECGYSYVDDYTDPLNDPEVLEEQIVEEQSEDVEEVVEEAVDIKPVVEETESDSLRNSNNSPSVILRSANVDFDGLIHLLFKYDISGVNQELRDKSFVVFRADNSELARVGLNMGEDVGSDNFRYSCPVPIVNYTDTIYVMVVSEAGEEISTTTGSGKPVQGGYPYSLQTYAEKKASSTNPTMAALAKALQDYGIASRLYFGQPVGGLTLSDAVKNLTVSDMNVNETVVTPKDQRPNGVKASQNVDFDSDNSLIVTFTVGAGHYSFKRNGQTVNIAPDANGKVVLKVTNIAPDQLNTPNTFSCSDNDSGKSFDIKTSVLGYAKRQAENGSANMQNLAKALYLYAKAAAAYSNTDFGDLPSSVTIDNLIYEMNGTGTCRVKAYNGTATSLTVPEKLPTNDPAVPASFRGATVTEIGAKAFEGNTKLTSIDLPDTVTLIATRAFAGCTSLGNMS